MQGHLKELALPDPLILAIIANSLVPLVCLSFEIEFQKRRWTLRFIGFLWVLIATPVLAFVIDPMLNPVEQNGPGDFFLGLITLVQAALILAIYFFVFVFALIQYLLGLYRNRRDANPGVH
ncbi:MAG: hypothetical protein INF16_13820 [Methylobacterium sp.]|nr:hypothetical protein [Methylobacterium sp.]